MMRPRVPSGLTPNYGSRNRFPVSPAPGGFSTNNNVQLISARVVDPIQWVVTLQPMVQSGFQALPWDAPWDGAALLPITGHVPQSDSIPYRVRVTWGAGGVRGDAFFDYPVAGGSFGVVADTLDLSVFNPTLVASVYATEEEIPVFGAFMVPGVSTNQLAPMNFADVPQSFAAGIGDVVRWSVKPYARRVWISQLLAPNAAVRYRVSFPGAGGNDWWNSYRVLDGDSIPQPIPVPNGTNHLRIENLTGGGGGMMFQPLWEIQLL